MKLKTSIQTVRILHVQVPEDWTPEQYASFQGSLQYLVPDGQSTRLKDGVEVDADTFENAEQDSFRDGWTRSVKPFVEAAISANWKLKPTCHAYLFHI